MDCREFREISQWATYSSPGKNCGDSDLGGGGGDKWMDLGDRVMN